MEFNKTIFITGFPGFIAERLVARTASPGTQFFLLVEDRMTDAAVHSVSRIAADTGTPLENFAIVAGDITQPDLGIEPDDLKTIQAETTDVFHLAAVYDLGVAESLARRVNVDGT